MYVHSIYTVYTHHIHAYTPWLAPAAAGQKTDVVAHLVC